MIISSAPLASSLLFNTLTLFTLVGLTCGVLGVWITRLQLTYLAESFPHAFLPGAALAALASFPVALGAGAGVLCVLLLIFFFTSLPRVAFDTAVAVGITVTVSITVTLTTLTQTNLETVLFGDPLASSPTTIYLVAAITLLVLAAVTVLRRRVLLLIFSKKSFSQANRSERMTFVIVAILLAGIVISSAATVGPLFLFVLLIAPATAARKFRIKPNAELFLAGFLGVFSTGLGIAISTAFNIATTSAVTLSCLTIFLLAYGFGKLLFLRAAPKIHRSSDD